MNYELLKNDTIEGSEGKVIHIVLHKGTEFHFADDKFISVFVVILLMAIMYICYARS